MKPCKLIIALPLLLLLAVGILGNSDTQSASPQTPATNGGSGQNALLGSLAQLIEKGRFREAEPLARRAVRASPQSAEAHNLLAIVCDRLGKAEEAEAQYRATLAIAPEFVSAQNNLGNLLLRLGRVPEAQQEFEGVLRVNPKHAQAHFNLGTLFVATAQYSEAATQFAEARKD